MSKGLTTLADIRREEQYKSLMELSGQDLCEMVRAHFESHPTLPGEKALKDEVNQRLALVENPPKDISELTDKSALIYAYVMDVMAKNKQDLTNDGFVPAENIPFDDIFKTEAEKENVASEYAKTRIRETPLKEGNQYLDFRHYDPSDLKRNPVDELPQKDGTSVHVDRTDVELQKNDAGEVYVLAELSDGGRRTIGTLPDNFLKNNPMNVESCTAELQIVDYSNGNMKNISAKIVVDTDLMSGDVLDLNDDLLSGLDQTAGLEQ